MDHLDGYRRLAAAVIEDVLRTEHRDRAAHWLKSADGRLWLAWLDKLNPNAIVEALQGWRPFRM